MAGDAAYELATRTDDPALSAAKSEWEKRGFRVIPRLSAPDITWVEEWANWNKEVLGAIKAIFGDKDGWSYFGNLFVYSIGEGALTADQLKEVTAIKAILAKEQMTFGDLGEMHGRIIHLISPELRTLLQGRAPGVLTVLDVIARIGGVV